MPRKKLNENLSALHRQLQGDAPLDEADKAHLRGVLSDIEAALEGETPGGHATEEAPRERLGLSIDETVARFEVSHPTIAATLHDVIELLKQL